MKKNILAIQMSSIIGDINANFSKIEFMIEEFYSKNPEFNPDIIILPEVWTTGWFCEIFKSLKDDKFQTENFLSKIARKHNVNIIGGSYIKETEGKLKNTCPVIKRDGEVFARYEKIHLYAPDGEAVDVDEGKTPLIVDIEGLKIGLSICYDIRFPELFRSYINSVHAPEMMINMSAWPLTRKNQYTSLAKARAIENQSYFLALSQTGEIKNGVYNSGNSILVDSTGETLYQLDEKEGYIFAEIDTETVCKTRETYPNLNARKVHNFGFAPDIKGALSYV